MPKAFTPKIVTANDLLSGDVVYFSTSGVWARCLAEAQVAQDAEAADALLAKADIPAQIVGPYLADVTVDPTGAPVPSHYREALRDLGPSNRLDLGRQAEQPMRQEHRNAA